jgi:branched-chain amino acid transport system ATP-binding protein
MAVKTSTASPPAIELAELAAGYGRHAVVHSVDLDAAPGEIVLLLGHNGAGKSTILKAILGLADQQAGRMRLAGHDLRGPVTRRVRDGIGYVPQLLGVFPGFTVQECLELGGYCLQGRSLLRTRLDEVFQLLPRLRDKRKMTAGLLSGGEQRLLTVGMALMVKPRLLLVDEPSAGLSPAFVDDVMGQLKELVSLESTPAILLVEQNVRAGLSIADRVYLLRQGRVGGVYTASELAKREQFWDLI